MKTYFVKILIIGTFLSCEGPMGEIGPNGKNSLVNLVDEPPGTNCKNGGIKVDSGIDKDDNGQLGNEEVNQTKFVCKGESGLDGGPGSDGKNSLVNVFAESNGGNCNNGGLKIELGIDSNSNGVLDPSEIKQTKYVCNGINGLPSLTVVTEEPSGSNCLGGGQKTQVGLDANGNLELDPSEIQLTKYECYPRVIEYPETGVYGNNVLLKNRTELTTRENSLAARISKNGKLKVIIKSISGDYWYWSSGGSWPVLNWLVSNFNFDNNSQIFQSIEGDRLSDLRMEFDKGEYIIEYYEFDATTPTMTKTITVNY